MQGAALEHRHTETGGARGFSLSEKPAERPAEVNRLIREFVDG